MRDDFLYFESLRDLAAWRPESAQLHQISNTPLAVRASPPTPPGLISKVLFCHDFKGGYHPTEHPQGQWPAESDPTETAIYTPEHLNLVSTFVYFTHKRVSVPPAPWINLCHRVGIPCLGTLLIEHAEGAAEAGRLFERGSEGEYIHCTQLTQLAQTHGFDGWLINIESSFPWRDWSPSALQGWLRELRAAGIQAVWYDAVNVLNMVHYQNGLTLLNAPFFAAADALFTNYTWGRPLLAASEIMARWFSRKQDVYTGIDIYGRGTFGGGGVNTPIALSAIAAAGTSVALFAPGWTFENYNGEHFAVQDLRFWFGVSAHVQAHPAGTAKYFHTTFNRGFGRGFWLDGALIDDKPWVHLGALAPLPLAGKLVNEYAWTGGWALECPNGTVPTKLFDLALTPEKSHVLSIVYNAREAGTAVYWDFTHPDLPRGRKRMWHALPQTGANYWGAWGTVRTHVITEAIPKGAVIVELGFVAPAGYLCFGQLGITLQPSIVSVEKMSSISPAILRPATGKRDGIRRSARLTWNVYPRHDEALEETRAAGMWSEKTKDFAWFVVRRGEVCRGLAWATEFLVTDEEVEEGADHGRWRVSGVRWDGVVVEGP
ncbi:glycosyl hydrolase family 85-domain-containing protein [Geopyxis carbonaria]|nr:glycosyl hydrolase family 85-domain-containing protein [Geopyxis carbonaria]